MIRYTKILTGRGFFSFHVLVKSKEIFSIKIFLINKGKVRIRQISLKRVLLQMLMGYAKTIQVLFFMISRVYLLK